MNRLWIAWERQRRTLNLSRLVGAELVIYDYKKRGLLRFPLLVARTVRLLVRHRQDLVFAQNPSMILVALCCVMKRMLRFPLVVDRHSNFMLGSTRPRSIRYRVFMALSRFTIRNADLTIVTNSQIARRVESAGGRPFIMPDPWSGLRTAAAKEYTPHGRLSILFPSTWANDEPIEEVVEACRGLEATVDVLITGRPRADRLRRLGRLPANCTLTGFLSDGDYGDLMASCDCVMPLTTFPEILVCGGYEGLSMNKPLILGDTRALREYFSAGALYTTCTADHLRTTMAVMRNRIGKLTAEAGQLYQTRVAEWRVAFEEFSARLASIEKGRTTSS